MTFNELAKYFEKLEQTSSRLSLIDILAQLFNQIELAEIRPVTYLLQGRVAPFFEPIEIGMAEKTVADSIAQAFATDRETVLKEYSQLGDLGLVAEKLRQRKKFPESKISVMEVFASLKQIAQTFGEGTVEKKITILCSLLKDLSPIGAKHLIRIPLGATRLGVGDPTILDAFARAKLGDHKNRQVLEEAYNKTSDLALIGTTLWQKGLVGVNKLDVRVGLPIRPELCERLPDAKTILEKMGGRVNAQYKYDGFRVQIHKKGSEVRFFSRNLEETTSMFPDLVRGVMLQVKADNVILDSEAVAFNPESEEFLPFQETTKRRRKYGIEQAEKELPLRGFVFDIMYLDGKSLMDLSLEDRLKKMAEVVGKGEVLIPQPGYSVSSAQDLEKIFDEAITAGLEGLVVKRPDSKYVAGGRNFNWVKLKRHAAGELKDTIDCVILGYIFGRGKRASFGAGALLVGVYDKARDEFVTVSKIGTGLTDEEWKEIHQRADKIKLSHKPSRVNSILTPSVWIEPKIVIEVLADEITRSPVHTAGKVEDAPGFALRFPRLVSFRQSDKKAEDATTVQELVEMFKQQKK